MLLCGSKIGSSSAIIILLSILKSVCAWCWTADGITTIVFAAQKLVEKRSYLAKSQRIPFANWQYSQRETRYCGIKKNISRLEPEEEGFRLGEMTKCISSPDTDGKIAARKQPGCIRRIHFGGQMCRVTFQFTSFSAHGAALALWDLCGLAVTYILTHHVLTKHRPHVTYTDSTWLWAPYLIVGVDFAILWTGIFVKKNSSWRQSFLWDLSMASLERPHELVSQLQDAIRTDRTALCSLIDSFIFIIWVSQ